MALARSFVGRNDVAEDIVQDSRIRWQSSSYPADRAIPVFRPIIAHPARDWFRRQKRQHRHYETYSILAELELDAQRIVIARQELRQVLRALKTIPEKSLIALKLHCLDGLTYRQIGAKMDISYARACQLVSQALAQAAMEMGDERQATQLFLPIVF